MILVFLSVYEDQRHELALFSVAHFVLRLFYFKGAGLTWDKGINRENFQS